MAVDLFDNWFDTIETEVRARARQFIEELIRGELDAALARARYGRSKMAGSEERAAVAGHRLGSRTRSLTGTFEPIEIEVPRGRLTTPGDGTADWKSQALRAYQRRTLARRADSEQLSRWRRIQTALVTHDPTRTWHHASAPSAAGGYAGDVDLYRSPKDGACFHRRSKGGR
jgi:hypothetical protein